MSPYTLTKFLSWLIESDLIGTGIVPVLAADGRFTDDELDEIQEAVDLVKVVEEE